MRINTLVVVDIASGRVLECESFEYQGWVAHAGPLMAFIPAIISAAATIGTSFMNKGGGAKEAKPQAMAAPAADQTSAASAEARRRQMNARGYQSTIMSDLSQTYGPGGLKQQTGA